MSSGLKPYYDVYCELEQPKCDVVLIHGWGMNSTVWDAWMPSLLKHFRVTVVDLPGMGRSPVSKGDYDLDYLVEQVLSVVPERAVWIGWSLGGTIMQAVLGRYPERVLAGVSLCTSAKFTKTEQWPGIETEALHHFQALIDEDWRGSLIRFMALQCKGSASQKSDINYLKERLLHFGLPALKALKSGLKVLENTDQRALFADLSKKLFVVLGSADEVVPASIESSLVALLGRDYVHVIEGASHLPFVSHTKDVHELTMNFLAGVLDGI